MKKFIIGILLFISMFSGLSTFNQKLDAQQELLIDLDTWSSINIFSTNFIMNSGFKIIPSEFDVGTISLWIPFTNFNTSSIGGQNSEIIFRNAAGSTITTITLASLKSGPIGGLYVIDVTGIANIYDLTVTVAQTYTATPGGYVQYYNDNAYLLLREPYFAEFYVENVFFDRIPYISNVILPTSYPLSGTTGNEFLWWEDQQGNEFLPWILYGKDIRFDAVFSGGETRPLDSLALFKGWSYIGPDDVIETGLVTIPTGSKTFTFFIPRSNRLRYETSQGESGIEFTIANEANQTFTLNQLLKENVFGPFLEQPYGLIQINLEEIPLNPLNTVTGFEVKIYAIETPDTAFVNFMNLNTYFDFTGNVFRANWYNGTSLFSSNSYTLFPTPPLPSPPPFGPLVFNEWVDGNQVPFNPNLIYSGNLNFFATFRAPTVSESVTTPVLPPNPTPPLQAFLTGLGLFNTEGFLFLFALIIILINFALVYYKFALGLIIVSNGIIAGMFMFLQFLPFWASFLFVSVIIFMIMLINGGMTRYE
jgi:hypothetical protein